jgi:hypothetical protein
MADLLERMRKLGGTFLRRVRLSESYKATFGTPEGKRVLADILKRAGMLETSMVEGDPAMTSFNEGKRALALSIIDELRWQPMDLVALAEARADDETRSLFEREAA